MKLVSILAGLGAAMFATSASAQHLDNLDTPYATRGACESAMASFNADVRDMLVENFPHLFGTEGEAASFITRAFTCERRSSDDNWYITDHRLDVVLSDWFQRRLD